jgi:WD repeat-containing protein 23
MSCGTVTLHSWNDGSQSDDAEPVMGLRVNDKLTHDESLYHNRPPSRYASLR